MKVYSNLKEEIAIIYDLRDKHALDALHMLRAAFQDYSEIEALSADHCVLIIRGGAARRLAR